MSTVIEKQLQLKNGTVLHDLAKLLDNKIWNAKNVMDCDGAKNVQSLAMFEFDFKLCHIRPTGTELISLTSDCCNPAHRQPWHITESISYPSERSAATKTPHTVPGHTQDQRRDTAHGTACYASLITNPISVRHVNIWANNQCSQEDCSYHQSSWRMSPIQSLLSRVRQPQQMRREMAVGVDATRQDGIINRGSIPVLQALHTGPGLLLPAYSIWV